MKAKNTLPEKMKAAVICEDKSMKYTEVPFPELKENEVLIKIKAAGVNRADLMQREGNYPPPPGWPEWPGLEVSGTIYAIGEKAAEKSSFKIGERVTALVGGGGYAEYIAADYKTVLHLPEEISFETGAGIPEAYATAYLNLVFEGGLKSGDTVFVFAAASGVGIAVIQIAKALGAKVIAAVRSDEKAETVKNIGADIVINTKKQPAELAFEEYGADIVIDCVGGSDMGKCFSRMNRFGRWIVIAALAGKYSEIDLETVYKKRLKIIGSTLRSRTDDEKYEILKKLEKDIFPLIAVGKIKPFIYAEYDIADVENAHKTMLENKNTGKIILKV